MVIRTTIMLDDDLLEKLRLQQAKMIKKSRKGVSLSQVLNDALRKEL